MSEPSDKPYQVGDTPVPEQKASRRPACCALSLLLLVACCAWVVWYWQTRIEPKLEQVTCSGRLKDFQIGATIYADRTGSYLYTGRGFSATFALLERTGDFHMGYSPRCPLQREYPAQGSASAKRGEDP